MDFLNKFTKAELIMFIRQSTHWTFRPPRESDLLRIRWEMRSNALKKADKLHTAKLREIGLKRRDEYAKKYNDSDDNLEKLELIKKMELHGKELAEWLAADEKITAQYTALDRLYASIDRARQKEREAQYD